MQHGRYLWAVLAAGIVVAACDTGISGANEGRLTIRLTDAPGDIKEAFIQIDEVRLFNNDSISNRIVLTPLQAGFIDLLALSGGRVLDIVDKALVPNGTYSQVRFVLGDSYVRLQDGRVFATPGATLPSGVTADGELKCPSCSQSGFKVIFPGAGLIVNSNSFVTIDFDVAQSFAHEAGNSGKLVLNPVLRATAQNVSFSNISGTVSLAPAVTLPACGGTPTKLSIFKPTAATASTTITAAVDTAGAYRIPSLLPGTYTMSSLKDYTYANGDSLTITSTPTPGSVILAGADSAQVNYSITAATCH